MNVKTKKGLAILLVFAMLFSIIPVGAAWAESTSIVDASNAAASITTDGTTTYYASLAEAVTNAESGDEIVLCADVTVAERETLNFADGVTLNANGHSITCNGTVTIGSNHQAEIVNNELHIIFEDVSYKYGGDKSHERVATQLQSTYYKAGDGYIICTYDSGSNTAYVQLVNATVNSTDGKGIVAGNEDLQIQFFGTNTINVTGEDSYGDVEGIYNNNSGGTDDVILDGEDGAVLNVKTGTATRSSRAVYALSLTIKGGTVNLVSGNGGTSICVDSSQGIIVEEGAVLNLTFGQGLMAMGAASSSYSGTINGLVIVQEGNNFVFKASGNTVLVADFSAVLEGSVVPFSVPTGSTLTINEGVTVDLSALTVENIDLTGTVTNNGTIKFPADFALDSAPKSGTVMIGEKCYTWNGIKWLCQNDASHIGGTATCMGYKCTACENWYGEKNANNHADTNTDHACDYGCTVVIGTHADSGKDHVCDYGCSVAIGTCEDANKDHTCDYGCGKVYGICEDKDLDHDCDYGCDETYGTHEDINTDHVCDYGCSVTIGTHEDTDKDHTCDYGCSEAIGTCEDANKDHTCDYGCGKAYGACEDKDLDHDCDYGCDKVYGTHEDTDNDHKCEYCDNTISDCTDSNNDYKCDTCGKDLPRPSTPSYDYNYDYSYDYTDTDATVSSTDDSVTVTADSITTSTLNEAKDAVAEDDSATIIGGKDSAVEVTAKENGSTVSSFSEPVTVTVPVSTSALKDVEDISKLTLALVETDANGDTTLTYIGGNYDTKTGTFSAYAAKPGNYVLVEKNDIIKIELTIGNQVAKVNGTPVVKDTHSRIIDSRTVVPVRFVAEQLGAKVDWNADTRTVTLTVDGQVITLPVDSIIPGYGTSAVIHDGRTLVPIRYIAEALGAHVVWVEEVQQVVIVK